VGAHSNYGMGGEREVERGKDIGRGKGENEHTLRIQDFDSDCLETVGEAKSNRNAY